MSAPNSPPQKAVYLSKEGKIFGPFNSAETLRMQSSGDWLLYPYIWDEARTAWVPNRAPPEVKSQTATEMRSTEGKSAICYNGDRLLTGDIEALTGNQCQVVGDAGATTPTFGVGSKIWIQINNLKTQEATCRSALVSSVFRDRSSWLYQLTLQ